jgi:hypothetical protein
LGGNKDIFGDAEESITFKDFKKKIKDLGYKYQTHVPNFGFSNSHRHLCVVDKEGNFICGSGANVYPSEHVEKHREVFDLLKKHRGKIFDEEGDKVLF